MDCGSGPVVGGTSTCFALVGSGQCGMKRTVREDDGTLPERPGVTGYGNLARRGVFAVAEWVGLSSVDYTRGCSFRTSFLGHFFFS